MDHSQVNYDDTNHNTSSIESLEELDWDGLLEVCKDKEEKLNLAGTYGLKLHEQLLEAQAHIDEIRAQHEEDIEKLIQETFELKNKLELKEKSVQSQQQEFEAYQKQITKKQQADIEELQNQSKKELSAIKKEKESTLCDLEQVQLREQHAVDKISRLEGKIHDLQAESHKKVHVIHPSQYENELFLVQEKVFSLEEEVEQCHTKMQEAQNENQTIALELRSKITESANLAKEVECAERRSTSYFNHLQQAREETSEIKAELDALKAELRSSGHSRKGNSLFGEVEDKRIEMEKRLLSMQVKHESLQKAYNFVKSQLHNMKTQVVALLQMNTGRADGERISHLERALSQAKAETLALTNKIKEVEAKQNLSTEGIQALARTLPHFETNEDMINFLSIQITDYKGKLVKLREELDQTYMVKLAESDKLQIAEQKLHETGILSEKYKNENMKLRLKLEETKHKLQAETQKRILIEKKFNYDSTDDVAPIGILNDGQMKVKKPLPYTLAKAKEKANGKLNQIQNKPCRPPPKLNFSAGMKWDLLPREILEELHIDKKKCDGRINGTENKVNNPHFTFHDASTKTPDQNPCKKNNTEQVKPGTTPLQATHNGYDIKEILHSRPRKVSFKDEPETIPVVITETFLDESVEDLTLTSMRSHDEVVKNNSIHASPLGTLKRGSTQLDRNVTNAILSSSPFTDRSNSVQERATANESTPIKVAKVTDDPDCKVQ